MLQAGENVGSDEQAVVRWLPFVEFMELLEFSHLRLEAPAGAASSSVIGTQMWRRGLGNEGPQLPGVYVCSTVQALHDAVLIPDNAQIRIETASSDLIRLRAVARESGRQAATPCVRVDLQALIRRVLVPAAAPAQLYDLVRHVVMTRLWIDVARI